MARGKVVTPRGARVGRTLSSVSLNGLIVFPFQAFVNNFSYFNFLKCIQNKNIKIALVSVNLDPFAS